MRSRLLTGTKVASTNPKTRAFLHKNEVKVWYRREIFSYKIVKEISELKA